jgi:hypothetical protein
MPSTPTRLRAGRSRSAGWARDVGYSVAPIWNTRERCAAIVQNATEPWSVVRMLSISRKLDQNPTGPLTGKQKLSAVELSDL